MLKAFLIMGPPGSGKSTQARLLAKEFGLTHLNTGDYLKELIKRGELPGEGYQSGGLVDSKLVLQALEDVVRDIRKSDSGIIFSGSPRTTIEAFGEGDRFGLIQLLEELYGKENIVALRLKLDEEVGMERNIERFEKRDIDAPEVAKIRIDEYRKHTEPVFEALEDHGIDVLEVDAKPAVEKVFENVKKCL